MKPQKSNFFSVAQYLEEAKKSPTKLEFLDGEIRAMGGGSPDHAMIAGNLLSLLKIALKDTCLVYGSDGQIAVQEENSYLFPDVSVFCEAVQVDAENPNSMLNPVLVVEVLSPHTEAYDRGDKFGKYRNIPTLKEYILVNSTKMEVEAYFRKDQSHWHYTFQHAASEKIYIQALNLYLDMREIYRSTALMKP